MYLTRYSTPEAVGYLVAEFIRCGKPGCRCRRGAEHGPYWYLHFRRREGGGWRPRKRYVAADQMPGLRDRLADTKAQDRATAALLAQARRVRAAVNEHSRGRISNEQVEATCHEIAAARGRPGHDA
ncbi:MAG: hypothetical protein PHU85_09105 [Phycisphaerae bacterium]|nr:hypothetical protein [Phycisphaerae bacterium]